MSNDIPMNGFIGWECAVCGACVASDKEGDPASRYWNVERKEVYCSAQHSLDRHEMTLITEGVR